MEIIKVENVSYRYKSYDSKPVDALKNVSFSVNEGEFLALVGANGSGKSTLAKCIVGLNKNYTGSLEINEEHPQLVFQDPYSSLNPMKKIGWILEEPLRIHGMKDKAKRRSNG